MSPDLVLLSRVAFRGREIAGPRVQELVALLAADLRAGCGVGRLVDGLWPDAQPENPPKALQILVSRARAQLGTDAIVRTPTGYRLTLTDDQVDAAAVLIRAAAAARCEQAGDHAAALSHAESGLALWYGDSAPRTGAAGASASTDAAGAAGDAAPFASAGAAALTGSAGAGGPASGLPDHDTSGPVGALRGARVSARRSLARARALALARLGRTAEAAGPLAELAADRPRDEEALLELLRCEAATIGPSAALARYDSYRRALRDDLGTDPGTALQTEHQRLLRATAPTSKRGVSYEPNPLLGRDDDVAAVEALLRTSRVTSIVGPGGLGKTRLAHAVARRAQLPAVTVVPLAGLAAENAAHHNPAPPGQGAASASAVAAEGGRATDYIAQEIAAALGVGEHRTPVGRAAPTADLPAAIAAHLATGPSLLVLDNCEHLVDAVADLVATLVAGTAELRILTTSRTPLGISSESVYPLPELDASTSVELFVHRARAARPNLDLHDDAVDELCRHLDGLPLAIELAAARTRTMSVAELAQKLDDRFVLLRGGTRDAPRRHQTLHAVVDWSWNLLHPTGRAAMRALSIFPDGFTAEAAGALDVDTDRLEHLVDHSLLKVVDTPSGTRFRMLETVREFSAERRTAADEDTSAFRAWARDFGAAHHDDLLGPGAHESVAATQAEQENLLCALRSALSQDDRPTIAAVAAVLGTLWTVDSNYPRLLTLIEQTSWALSHYRPEPALVEPTRTALTMSVAAVFGTTGPRPVRAAVALRRLPAAPPDTVIRAFSRLISTLRDTTELLRLCDSPEPLLASVANTVASYYWEAAGDVDAALKTARRALELIAERDLSWLRSTAQCRVAELCLQLELGAEARDLLTVALPAVLRLGALSNAGGIRAWLVLANLQLGDADEAERWLDGLPHVPIDDQVQAVGYDLGVRAELLLARGDVGAGLRLWRRVADQVQDTGAAAIPHDLDPWVVEARSVAVVAHARHDRLAAAHPDRLAAAHPDRLADVEDLVDTLCARLADLLTRPPANPPPYLVEQSMCGTLLLAIGLADCARARRTGENARSAVWMVALAGRFRFLRNFQPTMSATLARADAERADAVAYAEAVTAAADLDGDGLRAAALRLLAERR